MNLQIIPAYGHPQEIAALFQEYTDMLVEGEGSFREYLALQNYEEEVSHLELKYGLPQGRLYLAYDHLAVQKDFATSKSGIPYPAGCIGLRRIDAESCEMKRLYVRPAFRGRGLGAKLVKQVIADAKEIGYAYMLLDTLPFLQSAIRLYQAYGFYEIPQYNNSPVERAIYMKLDL